MGKTFGTRGKGGVVENWREESTFWSGALDAALAKTSPFREASELAPEADNAQRSRGTTSATFHSAATEDRV